VGFFFGQLKKSSYLCGMNTNNLKHKTIRFFQKVGLKILRASNQSNEPKHSEFEYECLAICKNLIHKEKSKLLISPISGKRYIKSEDNQIFVIMDNGKITIVNHHYSYNIDLTYKAYDRLLKTFDNQVEIRRQVMEDEIRSNVKHSLTNIYKNIANEKV
jgi:hypothetical protein